MAEIQEETHNYLSEQIDKRIAQGIFSSFGMALQGLGISQVSLSQIDHGGNVFEKNLLDNGVVVFRTDSDLILTKEVLHVSNRSVTLYQILKPRGDQYEVLGLIPLVDSGCVVNLISLVKDKGVFMSFVEESKHFPSRIFLSPRSYKEEGKNKIYVLLHEAGHSWLEIINKDSSFLGANLLILLENLVSTASLGRIKLTGLIIRAGKTIKYNERTSSAIALILLRRLKRAGNDLFPGFSWEELCLPFEIALCGYDKTLSERMKKGVLRIFSSHWYRKNLRSQGG